MASALRALAFIIEDMNSSKEARKKMTFKVFAFNKEMQPIQHGQMDDLERCYWRFQYWEKFGDDAYSADNCCYKEDPPTAEKKTDLLKE